MMRSDHRAEREWLDFIADLLATPLLSLPEEPIARKLTSALHSGGCAFNSVGIGHPVLRAWPRDFFGPVRDGVIKGAAEHSLPFHPLLRYHVVTGATAAVQVAEVPDCFRKQWRVGGWEAFYQARGAQHQMSIPLHVGLGEYRVFVVGRPTVYTEPEMRLARSVQRLLVGLDRQVSAFARWSTPMGGIATAAEADVRLTPREVAVMALVAEGITAAAAAHQLAIAERTVHKHLERIYKKLGVCDRVSAVRRAHRLGLLPSWEMGSRVPLT